MRTLLLSLAVGLVLSGCAGAAAEPVVSGAGLRGEEPVDPPPRPSFVLQDLSGQPYDFAVETAGEPTLLFFGYTDCPDECPTAMADISAALRQVPQEVADATTVVFVTTDPERDTPERLRDWLGAFDTRYVGLVGTQAEVDAAQEAVGAPVAERGGLVETLPGRPDEHVHAPGTAPHSHDRPLGYAVAHTSAIYAYDVSDRLPVIYPQGVLPADLAADLPILSRKESS